MKPEGSIVLTLLVVASTAAPAQAEWVITPYLGLNLAGDTEFRRGGPGGSVGYFGDRVGFEFDFGRYQHFFRDENVDYVPNNCVPSLPQGTPCIDVNTDAMGFMGNLVAPIRGKGAKWRPYVTAGVGVIHAWFEGPGDQFNAAQNNLAFNFGGGVMYSLNGRVGLRGDLRYFRALVDQEEREGGYFEDYGFLRATLGVTFTFPKRR